VTVVQRRFAQRRPRQGGYVLLSVVMTLLMAAAISYQLSRESAVNVNAAGGEAQSLQARYVAESGLAYAAARLNAGGTCSVIAAGAPITGLIGADSFSVTSTTLSTNPLTVQLVATPTLAATGTAFAPLAKRVVLYTRVEQQTTVYRAVSGVVADTFIAKGLGGVSGANAYNFGADRLLILDNGGKVTNILLRFDLAGALPANAKLKAAQLVLTPAPGWGNTNDNSDLTLHEATRAWSEGTGTIAAPGPGSSGATWDQVQPGVPWGFVRYLAPGSNVTASSGGGDYDPAYVDNEYVDSGAIPSTLAWDVTPLAGQWLANPAGNFGVLLKSEQALQQAKFVSSDDPARAKRPQLVLTSLLPCGGPSVALSVLDRTTAKAILVATVNTPVRLRIDLSNGATAAAGLSGALTVALPANVSVASPVVASTTGCGSMTFAPTAGDPTLTLLGGSIAAASGTAPGVCSVSVSVSGALPSGVATLATGPSGAATTFTIAAGQLVTSLGSNVAAASTSFYVVPLPTLAADALIDAWAPTSAYGTQNWVELMNNVQVRTLLRFSGLPAAGVPVQSATLRLYLRNLSSASGSAIGLQPYLLTTAWTEGSVYWNRSSGGNWNANGGDYTTTPALPATTLSAATTPWIPFDVAPAVNAWTAGTVNNGLILLSTVSAPSNRDDLILDSRERSGGNAAQLQITY
jgi:hypothetical protein